MKINNHEWEIVECEADDEGLIVNGTPRHASCWYEKNKIYVWKELIASRKMHSIIHELTHAHIESYGLFAFETFDHEQLCEFMGAHAENIVTMAICYMNESEGRKIES